MGVYQVLFQGKTTRINKARKRGQKKNDLFLFLFLYEAQQKPEKESGVSCVVTGLHWISSTVGLLVRI